MFFITPPDAAWSSLLLFFQLLPDVFWCLFTSEAAEDQVVKVVEQASKAIVNIKTEELIAANGG